MELRERRERVNQLTHYGLQYLNPFALDFKFGKFRITYGKTSSYKPTIRSWCTELLNQKLEFGGGLDSGFSLCAPTYYHTSEYFYIQCLEVWKLIQNRVYVRVHSI